MTLMRPGITLAAALLAGALNNGCSGTSDSAETPAPTTADQTPTTIVTTTPTVASVWLPHIATFKAANEDGYTATVTLKQSDLLNAELGMTNGDVTLGEACQVNPSTDSVVAVSIAVTGTTKNIPNLDFTAGWSVERPALNDERVAILRELDTGCRNMQEANALVTSGAERHGFIVLHNYRPPNGKPHVNQVLHAVIAIAGVAPAGATPGMFIVDTSGTGIRMIRDMRGRYGVPLIPANRGLGCWDPRSPAKTFCRE